jgi:hypothetical protein
MTGRSRKSKGHVVILLGHVLAQAVDRELA